MRFNFSCLYFENIVKYSYEDKRYRSCKVCKMLGADLTYIEMINVNALLHENEHTKKLLETADNENIKVVQIFGHDPEVMAKAVASPLLEKFDIIDINFGCPAPKIVKNGDGSALLKHLDKIAQICKSCTDATSKPITAKIRIGFDANENNAIEVAKICEQNGISAITVHGRTRAGAFDSSVEYDTIAQVASELTIPVVANGDITDANRALAVLRYTGAQAVMIGRAALGRPWLFKEIKETLRSGVPFELSRKEKVEAILSHRRWHFECYPEPVAVMTFRKHLLWYLTGWPGFEEVRSDLCQAPDALMQGRCLLDYFKRQGWL